MSLTSQNKCFVWSYDNTLENCFIQISSYSRAYVVIIYEMGPPVRKQNIKAKEVYSLWRESWKITCTVSPLENQFDCCLFDNLHRIFWSLTYFRVLVGLLCFVFFVCLFVFKLHINLLSSINCYFHRWCSSAVVSSSLENCVYRYSKPSCQPVSRWTHADD